jgi:hypothetical protein
MLITLKLTFLGDLSVTLDIGSTKPRMLMLSWHMRVVTEDVNPNVTFTAKVRYESQVFYLHYVTAEFLIQAKVISLFQLYTNYVFLKY